MDTWPSGSPPRVRPSVKRAAGMAPNIIDGVDSVDVDTWIRTSGDIFATRRKSKNGLVMKVALSQEKIVM